MIIVIVEVVVEIVAHLTDHPHRVSGSAKIGIGLLTCQELPTFHSNPHLTRRHQVNDAEVPVEHRRVERRIVTSRQVEALTCIHACLILIHPLVELDPLT